MKTTKLWLTLVLIFISAVSMKAETGTMEQLGAKMQYSFSGGTVIGKDLKATSGTGAFNREMAVFIQGEIKEGATLNVGCKKLAGLSKWKKVKIFYTIDNKNGKNIEGELSVNHSIAVPKNAKNISVTMEYYSHVSKLCCYTDWKVVKDDKNSGGATSGSANGVISFKTREHKMKYSFSGGKIHKLDNQGTYMYDHYYSSYVKRGSTLSANVSVERTDGKKISKPLKLTFVFRNDRGKIILPDVEKEVKPTSTSASVSLSTTFPENAHRVDCFASFFPLDDCKPIIRYYAEEDEKKTSSTSTSFEDVSIFDKCPECHDKFSGFYIQEVKSGTNKNAGPFHICGKAVTQKYLHQERANEKTLFPPNMVDISRKDVPYRGTYGSAIYVNDFIQTQDRCVVLQYGDEENAITIKENTQVLLEGFVNGKARWRVKGTVVGEGLKKTEKKQSFSLTNCLAELFGTSYVIKDDGKSSVVYLLSGSIKITNSAKKSYMLQPGEVSTVASDGKINVNKFDVDKLAKQYGISMSGKRDSYSNKSNAVQSFIGDVVVGKDMEYKIISDNTAEVVKCKGSGQVKISNTLNYEGKQYKVVRIAKDAFKGMMNVTTVEIPSNVVTIKEDAFLNCGLTNLTVWADNVRIEQKAFHNCLKLVTATVKGKTPHCSFDAFIGCSSMRELFIRDIKADSYGKKPNGTNAIIKKLK
jgi:hypothetical protein